jgi:hypothetical protein
MPNFTYRPTGQKCPKCGAIVNAKILLSQSSQMAEEGRAQERPDGFSCSRCSWKTPDAAHFDVAP